MDRESESEREREAGVEEKRKKGTTGQLLLRQQPRSAEGAEGFCPPLLPWKHKNGILKTPRGVLEEFQPLRRELEGLHSRGQPPLAESESCSPRNSFFFPSSPPPLPKIEIWRFQTSPIPFRREPFCLIQSQTCTRRRRRRRRESEKPSQGSRKCRREKSKKEREQFQKRFEFFFFTSLDLDPPLLSLSLSFFFFLFFSYFVTS